MKATFTLIFALTLFALTSSAQNIKVIPFQNKGETRLKMLENKGTSFTVLNNISSLKCFDVSTEKGTFAKLEIEGYAHSSNYGAPELPLISTLIEIPQDAEVTVSVISYDEELVNLSDYGITNKLFPCQPSMSKCVDPSTV
jgi:hypothetical protein